MWTELSRAYFQPLEYAPSSLFYGTGLNLKSVGCFSIMKSVLLRFLCPLHCLCIGYFLEVPFGASYYICLTFDFECRFNAFIVILILFPCWLFFVLWFWIFILMHFFDQLFCTFVSFCKDTWMCWNLHECNLFFFLMLFLNWWTQVHKLKPFEYFLWSPSALQTVEQCIHSKNLKFFLLIYTLLGISSADPTASFWKISQSKSVSGPYIGGLCSPPLLPGSTSSNSIQLHLDCRWRTFSKMEFKFNPVWTIFQISDSNRACHALKYSLIHIKADTGLHTL